MTLEQIGRKEIRELLDWVYERAVAEGVLSDALRRCFVNNVDGDTNSADALCTRGSDRLPRAVAWR